MDIEFCQFSAHSLEGVLFVSGLSLELRLHLGLPLQPLPVCTHSPAFPCVSWLRYFLKSTGHLFCRKFLSLVFWRVFTIDWDEIFWEGISEKHCASLRAWHQVVHNINILLLVLLNLAYLDMIYLTIFHYKITTFPMFIINILRWRLLWCCGSWSFSQAFAH